MVAVWTRISPRPPHRSRRALLTHRAPPSGFGVEAVTRQRVYSSDWRKEAGDELDEPLPAEACRLAASLERCAPEPLHLVEEPPQARMVTRDSEVVQMPFQHLFHPSPVLAMGSCIFLRNSILIASRLARIRFLIVLRPMTNEPHLRDRVQKCVKPRKSKVSGFPSPSFSRCLAAWRPKRISRVLSGCNANLNLHIRSLRSSRNVRASCSC